MNALLFHACQISNWETHKKEENIRNINWISHTSATFYSHKSVDMFCTKKLFQ